MAVDPHKVGLSERDLEQLQALAVLKKGSHLLKYGRRGKPKFCAFRLSNDESALIWYSQSSKKDKSVKLSNVSRIIPGQRTAVFQRYPRPEKDYQSFSLILPDRSLDLICKDKEEADIWFVALKTIISRNHKQRNEPDSPQYRMRGNCPSIPPLFFKNDLGDAHPLQMTTERMSPNSLGKTFADIILYTASPKNIGQAESVSSSLNSISVACSDNSPARSPTSEAMRISLSSHKSSSSQGSSHVDYDAMGDIFIWGEGSGDGMLGGGMHKIPSSPRPKADALLLPKADAFLPKAVVSAVILDVHSVACGSGHAVLVSKQGEIFSWGEEVGGRLGLGLEANVSRPKLIDTRTGLNFESVACGEHHSCAVTLSGELYTWGDGIHSLGLLGHGSETSHWVPKRVSGDLDGIQVTFVACGPWHTAAVTSLGQLFTFGDGSFGTLGHGDRSSTRIPREVLALRGQHTTRVSCGVWHTAAVVVEVPKDELPCSGYTDSTSWGKLFTWGDGYKSRLGHADQEPKLLPVCVSKMSDENICQVACGNNITVALTTSGRVYTMGSPNYNDTKGEAPNRVLGKIADSFVEEIACGSYHVAVRTAKSEVYTWGRGRNGQLGHGDSNDRSTPTPVEFLRDKQVKSVKCGSNFTTAICLQKGSSGSDNSVCSACHNPFGFRRKCHNCYNCGLVFCHACSSKKSLKASLAPDMNKPYRVCDDCFAKLKSAMESCSAVRGPKGGVGSRETRIPLVQKQLSHPSSFGSSNQAESRYCRHDINMESYDSRGGDSCIGMFQLKAASLKASMFPLSPSKKASSASSMLTFSPSKKASSTSSMFPFSPSKKASSASSMFPFSPSKKASSASASASVLSPKFASRASSSHLVSSPTSRASKQRNDVVSKETLLLRAQVDHLTRKSQQLEVELQRTSKQLKDEAERCNSAKEVIRLLTAQLKEATERVPEVIHTDQSGKGSEIPDLVTNESPTINRITTENESSQSKGNSENQTLSTEEPELKPQPERAEQTVHIVPGVYATLISLPGGGGKELKRIRFSRKHFTQEQAQKWWDEHAAEVCEQHDIRIT